MDYTNSKLECPVCSREFAKNYLSTHLSKQHANIYGTEDWEKSRYNIKFIKIKENHNTKYNIKQNALCSEKDTKQEPLYG